MKNILIVLILILSINVSSQIYLKDGDIIVRNVLGTNFIKHYGIVYKDKIVEYNQTGIHYSTLAEFLNNGKIVHIDSTLRNHKDIIKKIEVAIEEYKDKPYSFKNNCESFVNFAKTGMPVSLQYELIDYIFSTLNN